jgi:hypothetical protein
MDRARRMTTQRRHLPQRPAARLVTDTNADDGE